MRVLVVEDNPTDRLLIEEIVRARGHEAVGCGDAESAWARFQEERFPLVLLDLWLPGMDGLDLCREIRALPEGDESVIVVITGVSRREVLEEVLEAGADDYVLKPVTHAMLHVRLAVAERRVRELARQRRRERELASHALRDPVTDLANRALFMERLEHATRRARRRREYLFAVLYVQVDEEERREEGDASGSSEVLPDEVLRELGHRMEECVRAIDTVAREIGREHV